MKAKIQVVCGVFRRTTSKGLEVALFERKEPREEFEFPGGKIEPGETPLQALRRELEEELGVQVVVGDEIGRSSHEYTKVIVDLTAFWVESDHFQFQLVDHLRWQWADQFEWRRLAIAAPDIPLLEKIFA